MQYELTFDSGVGVSLEEGEEWREVVGFPRYEVSSYGRFRNKATGRHLGGTVADNGYVHIGLFRDGFQVCKLAHRLVAETFLVRPSERHLEVNHKDKVRANNRVRNLEWSTRSWNSRHAKTA